MTILLCGVLAELGAASIEALSPGEVVSSTPELSEALRSVATACPAIIVVGGATVQMVARSCRELRAIDSRRRAIIVALGGDRPEDVQNLLEAGADDFFAGALDGDQLRSRLLVARRLAADLARHRATERALRELSESLRTTLNSIGDGVITTDSHGVIVRMNPIAEKLTGWAVDEAKGASLSGILPLVNSDTRSKIENPFDHAFREGVSVALAPHTLLVRKDGGEIPIADSCAPIKSSDGRFDGAVLVFRDLTAQQERSDVIDLIPVIELSINMAYNEIRHCARIVKDYGPLPLVEADDARLGQVFINLLVNAAQAFPEGNARPNEIRIVTSTDAAGRALVEVRDNGPGIAPDVLARIFDPFFTTKALGAGTGLGLAISHNIVTGMGGTITAQSELTRGTTFRVTLPASASLEVTARTSSAPPHTSTGRPATVLVIDDEPAIGMAIRRVLRHHNVTAVTTAQEALDILGTGKEFDVVLSDLMMPGMSGMELYRTLSKTSPKMAARIVFLTGGAFTPEANVFLDGISNERMEKPFVAGKLRGMVQSFVKS